MPLINEILEDIADIKNILPTSEIEGTELSIEDSTNMRMKNLKLKGSISQDGDPTPDEPINIEVLTGDVNITIDDVNYTLNLNDLELCGNDTYGRDYLFRKNGKWYKASFWGKVIFDGSENFEYNEDYKYFKCPTYIHKYTFKENGYQYCTHFLTNIRNWSNTASSFLTLTDTDMIYVLQNSGYKVCIRNTAYTNADDFEAWLQECYDNGNPVTVYTQLAEETDEEITDTTLIQQLNHLTNVRLNKGTSTISSDNDKLIFDIEYYKDLDSILN